MMDLNFLRLLLFGLGVHPVELSSCLRTIRINSGGSFARRPTRDQLTSMRSRIIVYDAPPSSLILFCRRRARSAELVGVASSEVWETSTATPLAEDRVSSWLMSFIGGEQ